MPTSDLSTKNRGRITRRVKKRWVVLGLLLAVGYVKYAPPLNPPSSVFSDPAAEKRYFHNGRDGIVLHYYGNQYEAYLEAEWEYTGFDETYLTLNVYRVFKGGWFRPTSKMLLYQIDATNRPIIRADGLFYRKGKRILLRTNSGVAKAEFDHLLFEEFGSR